ncbi:MAG: CusA/CzcA family heavy metal efflux transporter [Ferruginibacter sp.]|nr:CusA/CzcA family heavy metal efflux transporter [Ferruginibacter sp.]
MLNKIIQFSVGNKLIIGVFTLALIIWGVWSASKLPIDAVPDITNNQVQIITITPTLASQEVEQFVTYPIEQSIANLPDIQEMRSISRFGLSNVTVVFHDDVDIYFARQLISEKLREAQEKIPKGVGTPELAPVSTGLGEVYQYVIHPKKGAEAKYSAMDLRTMQDWIVARQLYGTPGIAEVSSFGGMLKQYEVAVNPARLKAMNVSIAEIFSALEKNNQNTGGAYIDKKPNAYFIRGIGLISSIEEINTIAVKNSGIGVPVLIRDVAEVKYGNAVRYGALTYNGDKEVVGGIVMMLKGANSAAVVERVKEKMTTIQKSLPPDVEIEAFIDRTGLVKRAIGTVESNLLEGALIVIFVLIVFLGNFRAGLIVASAIPLSLLFALALMNLFGVSANLMSLGAIDFGLIVDGAVIIVEATLHLLAAKQSKEKLTQQQMDNAVKESAGKMMSSAAFGQVIILIVYLPILTLEGIEGKMFSPMAKTVAFAILGALLLSLTYIPMMSALFLSKKAVHKKNFSDKMMDFFQRGYNPLLRAAIRIRYLVVGIAVLLLLITGFIFSRMGGEFIPQLEEGDYAFEFKLPQGTSLSQSIETSMQAARLIKQFPEVTAVVGKTGSGEIPTDPMPPEATDLMIVLKDKKDWTTTKDYKELSEMMAEKLSVLPGVFVEESQPIQMRFNELMTGVKQDVAVKVFGENIDTLAMLAERVAKVISKAKGAGAPQIERTTGLPQITIQYDRARLSNYGLNVEDVNRTVSTAFAGEVAGVVYENERKFDLVVRLDSANRSSIEDVSNLYISTSTNNQIPLSQVATVAFKEGPSQITREDGKRRIVIGFNIEGKDVQTVVKDIQQRLANANILPQGYYYTYGGTFENLQKASARLMIVVPLALLLIFFMLYFTFSSIKDAALIFTAIPMSAIGGVFALLIRGMPFSISAGVGFIALFGVAVLNGIVLISTFNQLKKEGMTDVFDRVLAGTKMRLRPVLMTATVAALGFLPMAFSTGAGGEVQKPLATVVIGGLITATFLTLVVVPCLYIIFSGKRKSFSMQAARVVLPLMILCASQASYAQPTPPVVRIGFEDLFNKSLRNNLQLQSAELQVKRGAALTATGFAAPNTGFFVENEDMAPADRKGILKIGLSQSLDWPGLYKARTGLLREQAKTYQAVQAVKILELRRNLQKAYYTVWYYQSKVQLWSKLDSIYNSLSKAAVLRVKTGESAGLDSISAIAKARETSAQLQLLYKDIEGEQELLRLSTNTDSFYLPVPGMLQKLPINFSDTALYLHPVAQLQQQNIAVASAELELTRQSRKPNFEGRFFSQRLYGTAPYYSGFSVTVGIPILGKKSFNNLVAAGKLEQQYQASLFNYQKQLLSVEYRTAVLSIEKNKSLLDYYEQTGLQQANAIIQAANLSYRSGEIGFAELSQYLTQAIDIQRNYLDVLNQYNQSVIEFNYYVNR